MSRRKVLILGAAGRDFHNFNTVYRGDSSVEVVAFTATQIPDIEGRTYPAALAGEGYPEGIPIRPEEELEAIIRAEGVHEAVFSYSDVSHEYVMHLGSRVVAAGAGRHVVVRVISILVSCPPRASPMVVAFSRSDSKAMNTTSCADRAHEGAPVSAKRTIQVSMTHCKSSV